MGGSMKKFEDAVQPERRAKLEALARQDADAADLRYPQENMVSMPSLSDLRKGATYMDQVVHAGEGLVYIDAYKKRIARRERSNQ
jgi:hypothetical protein